MRSASHSFFGYAAGVDYRLSPNTALRFAPRRHVDQLGSRFDDLTSLVAMPLFVRATVAAGA